MIPFFVKNKSSLVFLSIILKMTNFSKKHLPLPHCKLFYRGFLFEDEESPDNVEHHAT
jgi:hypothetical protein